MSKVNVSAKSSVTVITGLPGTGKSTYVDKHYLQNPHKKRILIVDPQQEYKPSNKYTIFRIKNYDIEHASDEFNMLANAILRHPNTVDILIIDESNVVLPKKRLYSHTVKLMNTLRHVGLEVVLVARRPTDINITASEFATKRIIFKSSGKNDIAYLNDIEAGLGDKAAKLQGHEYITWQP